MAEHLAWDSSGRREPHCPPWPVGGSCPCRRRKLDRTRDARYIPTGLRRYGKALARVARFPGIHRDSQQPTQGNGPLHHRHRTLSARPLKRKAEGRLSIPEHAVAAGISAQHSERHGKLLGPAQLTDLSGMMLPSWTFSLVATDSGTRHIGSSGRRRAHRECLLGRPRPSTLREWRTNSEGVPEGACCATDRSRLPVAASSPLLPSTSPRVTPGAACGEPAEGRSVSRPQAEMARLNTRLLTTAHAAFKQVATFQFAA